MSVAMTVIFDAQDIAHEMRCLLNTIPRSGRRVVASNPGPFVPVASPGGLEPQAVMSASSTSRNPLQIGISMLARVRSSTSIHCVSLVNHWLEPSSPDLSRPLEAVSVQANLGWRQHYFALRRRTCRIGAFY